MAKGGTSKGVRRAIWVPGSEGWEYWEPGAGGYYRLVQEAPEPQGQSRAWMLALPVQQVITFPLWLGSRNAALFGEMIALQLDRRGLVQRSQSETVMFYEIVEQEAERTLVRVQVLPPSLPEVLCQATVPHYESSARLYSYQGNSLVFWRELGKWVIAFSRNGRLLHAQVMEENVIGNQWIQEVLCLMLPLESERVSLGVDRIEFRTPVMESDQRMAQEGFRLPVQVVNRPTPSVPEVLSGLTPGLVRESQVQQSQNNRRRIFWVLAVLVYLLLVGGLVGYRWWVERALEQKLREISESSGMVQQLKQTAQLWQALQPVIDPEHYPLELLWKCTRLVPQDGVRLTLFDCDRGKITIQGEAQSQEAAFRFTTELSQHPELKEYHWVTPPPKILPNQTAQFIIEGGRSQ